MAINIAGLLSAIPQRPIQQPQSKLDSILYLIAKNQESSRTNNQQAGPVDAFGAGLGSGIARGSDVAVAHMLNKDLQTSSQSFQAGENKLNREATASENKLNRDQRKLEFDAEQQYRKDRLALEQQIADDNYDFKVNDYYRQRANDASTRRLQSLQAKGLELDNKIKEAKDPAELARLERERSEILLTGAKTDYETSKLKLKEAENQFKRIDPADIEAFRSGQLDKISSPEVARQIAALESTRAQIESMADKGDKALDDASQKIIAQSFVDRNLDPRSTVLSLTHRRQKNTPTQDAVEYEKNKRDEVTTLVRTELKKLNPDFSKPESIGQVKSILNDLSLTSLSDKEQSQIENDIFEKKLIPNLTGPMGRSNFGMGKTMATDKDFLTNLTLMNELKVNRGRKPLVPTINNVGDVVSFREGTTSELDEFYKNLKRFKGE